MRAEEDIAHLEAENTALTYRSESPRQQLAQVLAHPLKLEEPVAKESHNSSKPPSSDGPTRKTRSQRKPSGRKTGGQPGHPRHILPLVVQPDEVVRHRPRVCAHCQQLLEGMPGEVVERRQVQDLPPWRLLVS